VFAPSVAAISVHRSRRGVVHDAVVYDSRGGWTLTVADRRRQSFIGHRCKQTPHQPYWPSLYVLRPQTARGEVRRARRVRRSPPPRRCRPRSTAFDRSGWAPRPPKLRRRTDTEKSIVDENAMNRAMSD